MAESVTNTRIAKNTVFLYIRMLLVMAITLYTSRIVLRVLGIEDYGINNAVGSLATSFAFFSSSLSNATQRFLNIEIGKNDTKGITRVFSASIIIYILIIIAVIIVAETIGLRFVEQKMIIPANRLDAALWVFQAVVLGLAVTLIGSVFDAVLIAYENMKIYAYLSFFDVSLKLLIVFILEYIDFDKLKLYAILLMFSHILIKLITALYCIKKYPACKFKFIWNTDLFKNIFRFISWNGIGTAVWMVNEQGMNVLLNLFFGPVVNAARGVSSQVGAAVNNFTNNFLTAVRPQIIKSYAAEDYTYFNKLILYSSKYSFFLIWLLCLPIILSSEAILKIWLHDVPEYATVFVQWVLLFNCINVLTNPPWTAMQAVGKLKKYILVGSTIFLMAFPISYVFLKLGHSPIIIFQVLVVVRVIYLFVSLFIMRQYIGISLKMYTIKVVSPILKVVSISFIVMWYINSYINTDLGGILLTTSLSFLATLLSIYLTGINSNERDMLIGKIKQFITK